VLYKLAQLHIELSNTGHKQLKIIAAAKSMTVSSLARSYIQRGINGELNSTTTAMGKKPNHLSLQQTSTPVLVFQEQQVQTNMQFSPLPKIQAEYNTRTSSELNELHKHFFARCYLEARNPFFYCEEVHNEFSLMAITSKNKLIDHMLVRGKDQKLFKVHEALVKLIINNMINQRIIVRVREDLLASPMLLLEGITRISIPGLFDVSNSQAASSVMVSEHRMVQVA
jgi:hypothetical protein